MLRVNSTTKAAKRLCKPNANKPASTVCACCTGWSRWVPRFGSAGRLFCCGRSSPRPVKTDPLLSRLRSCESIQSSRSPRVASLNECTWEQELV